MDLDNKYVLGEVVANDSESKTFRAREVATGRELLVHLLFGGKPAAGGESLLAILLHRMTDPAPEKRRQIVEISDYKGMPYAVTEVLPGFQGMRAWVEQERGIRPAAPSDPLVKAGMWKVPGAPAAAPLKPAAPQDEFEKLFGQARPEVAPPPPTPPPVAPGHHEGEFTRLFRSTVGETAPPPAAPARPAAAPPPLPPAAVAPAPAPRPAAVPPPPPPAAAAPPPPPPPPPAAPAAQGPGEFTRMFQSAQTPEAMPPEPVAPPLASGGSAPGEFTRMFQTPEGASAPPPLAPPQPPADEFARMFQTPQPQQPFAPPAPAPPYAPPAPPPPAPSYEMPPAAGGGSHVGEFTRLFGTPGAGGGAPVVPPTAPAEPKGATGVFTPHSTPSAASASMPPAGPGEYTRLFGAHASYAATDVGGPPAPPRPPQPMAAPPPLVMAPPPVRRQPSAFLPVVIISAFVLLAGMALILYFVMKK